MIGSGGKVSLKRLVRRTALPRNRLAREADLYSETIRKAVDGKKIRADSAEKLVQTLNRLLGTNYELEDIEGLHISGENIEDE